MEVEGTGMGRRCSGEADGSGRTQAMTAEVVVGRRWQGGRGRAHGRGRRQRWWEEVVEEKATMVQIPQEGQAQEGKW